MIQCVYVCMCVCVCVCMCVYIPHIKNEGICPPKDIRTNTQMFIETLFIIAPQIETTQNSISIRIKNKL